MAQIRKVRGLTQAQLAERLGVAQRDISNYESGKIKPRIDTAQKIADALGCAVEDLDL